MKPSVLLVDNHDSFTYNLAGILEESGLCKLKVCFNDQLRMGMMKSCDKILFSPGPGIPKEYPQMREIIERFGASKSILGICLGHQAIVESLGGSLFRLNKVMHGSRQQIQLSEPLDPLFLGLPKRFHVGLYHSWAANPSNLPSSLHVTVTGRDGIIMGISHDSMDLKGLQFHPESYMTEYGHKMISNWLKSK
ncbi:MAG: aminodeoxychorismate/anthranilate synthase component II [Bacteroidetes bacterium]|nr:aminodeoxychorismate/anthranilate synthase component II [Bacteroidota bacterium]